MFPAYQMPASCLSATHLEIEELSRSEEFSTHGSAPAVKASAPSRLGTPIIRAIDSPAEPLHDRLGYPREEICNQLISLTAHLHSLITVITYVLPRLTLRQPRYIEVITAAITDVAFTPARRHCSTRPYARRTPRGEMLVRATSLLVGVMYVHIYGVC